MLHRKKSLALRIATVLLCCLGLSACIGTVVGAVVDTAIEVVKIPVKVGAAVIDVVTPDDFTEQGAADRQPDLHDDGAVQMENEAL